MRVIIAGGTGPIGRAISADLVRDGHEAIVLSRSPEQKKALMAEGVQLVRWDNRTAEGWGHLVDGADAVIVFAGAPLPGTGLIPTRWTPARKKVLVESRVNGGQAVVEAIRAASVKPKLLIQASAVGYYGPQLEGDQTEESPPGDDFMARILLQFHASTEPVEAMGVRRVVIHSGVVLYSGAYILTMMSLPFKMFVGGPLGSGRQWISWIHMEDQVRAIRYLLDKEDASGMYNLSAPDPKRNADFGRTLGRVLNRPYWFPVPEFAFRLVLGEVADTVLTGQKVLPKRLLDEGFKFRHPTLEGALHSIFNKG